MGRKLVEVSTHVSPVAANSNRVRRSLLLATVAAFLVLQLVAVPLHADGKSSCVARGGSESGSHACNLCMAGIFVAAPAPATLIFVAQASRLEGGPAAHSPQPLARRTDSPRAPPVA